MAKAVCDRELKRKFEEINKSHDDDNEIIFCHGQRQLATIPREEVHHVSDLRARCKALTKSFFSEKRLEEEDITFEFFRSNFKDEIAKIGIEDNTKWVDFIRYLYLDFEDDVMVFDFVKYAVVYWTDDDCIMVNQWENGMLEEIGFIERAFVCTLEDLTRKVQHHYMTDIVNAKLVLRRRDPISFAYEDIGDLEDDELLSKINRVHIGDEFDIGESDDEPEEGESYDETEEGESEDETEEGESHDETEEGEREDETEEGESHDETQEGESNNNEEEEVDEGGEDDESP